MFLHINGTAFAYVFGKHYRLLFAFLSFNNISFKEKNASTTLGETWLFVVQLVVI